MKRQDKIKMFLKHIVIEAMGGSAFFFTLFYFDDFSLM